VSFLLDNFFHKGTGNSEMKIRKFSEVKAIS